jgi:predicted transglutaminase-like cysteine proteinase
MSGVFGRLLGVSLAAAVGISALPRTSFAETGPAQVAFLVDRGRTLPPIGWVEFCRRSRDECRPARGEVAPATVSHAAADWRAVSALNREVNAAVEPMTDADQWGVVERWTYPATGYGDCEDYVLEKRRRLAALGIPDASMMIAVVLDENQEGHAVLLLRTDRGDFVLDNKTDRILHWTKTPYRFLKRQAADDPKRWVALDDRAASASVAAAPRLAPLP